MLGIPNEICEEILTRLGTRHLAISRGVCKSWRIACDFIFLGIKDDIEELFEFVFVNGRRESIEWFASLFPSFYDDFGLDFIDGHSIEDIQFPEVSRAAIELFDITNLFDIYNILTHTEGRSETSKWIINKFNLSYEKYATFESGSVTMFEEHAESYQMYDIYLIFPEYFLQNTLHYVKLACANGWSWIAEDLIQDSRISEKDLFEEGYGMVYDAHRRDKNDFLSFLIDHYKMSYLHYGDIIANAYYYRHY